MSLKGQFLAMQVLNEGDHNFILKSLSDLGYDAYIVGGCVRDVLMHKTPHDWDICTSATPETVKQVFSNYRIIETGLKHGTVTVIYNDVSYEITTFRTECSYTDSRHPDKVEFISSIHDDLARRDFTMNAVAYNPNTGFVDPFNGVEDIEKGIIRCVGDPDERFQEDALRILRAMRFASVLNFHIEDDTYLSMHFNKKILTRISAERIQSELCKMLLGESICRVMLQCYEVIGIIIPEMRKCFGFTQNNKYHQYTVYSHIAHAVANYTGSDKVTKVALLLHDIGKPQCYTEDVEGHGHFYGHAEPSAQIADKVLTRLKFDIATREAVVELIENHDVVMNPTPKTVKRWLNRLGEKQFMRLMDIRLADIQAHAEGTQESRIERRNKCLEIAQEIIRDNQCFKLKDLAVDGSDCIYLGMKEGPEVGHMLHNLLELVINGNLENNRDMLLKFIQDSLD